MSIILEKQRPDGGYDKVEFSFDSLATHVADRTKELVEEGLEAFRHGPTGPFRWPWSFGFSDKVEGVEELDGRVDAEIRQALQSFQLHLIKCGKKPADGVLEVQGVVYLQNEQGPDAIAGELVWIPNQEYVDDRS